MTQRVKSTLLALAARTASANGTDQSSNGCRGVVLTIVATASAATPSVVVKVQGKDNLGNYYDITGAAATAVTGAGTSTLTVYPGVPVTTGVSTSQPLPSTWRIVATAGDADSLTYSVCAELIP
jgi:hypothetical protein